MLTETASIPLTRAAKASVNTASRAPNTIESEPEPPAILSATVKLANPSTVSAPAPNVSVSAPVPIVTVSAPSPVVAVTPPVPRFTSTPPVWLAALTVTISLSKAAVIVSPVSPVTSSAVAPTPVVCKSAIVFATDPVSMETVSIVLVAPAADVRATVVAVAPSTSIKRSSDALAIAAFEKFTVTVSLADVFSPTVAKACILLNVMLSSEETTFKVVRPVTAVMSTVLALFSAVILNV